MNNNLMLAVIVPILIVLGIQAYLLFQLNSQVYHLSGLIDKTGSSQLALPKYSVCTPGKTSCGSEHGYRQAESY